MKKIIFLLMISAMGLNISASAQKAITTEHYYDVKNAGMEKAYIASLKEVNAIMIEIGYPNNLYEIK